MPENLRTHNVHASYDLSVHKTAELRQVFHEIPTRPQLTSLSTSFRYFVVVGRLVRTRTQKNPTMNDDGSNHDARRGVDDDKPLSSWASRTTPKHWVLVHPISGSCCLRRTGSSYAIPPSDTQVDHRPDNSGNYCHKGVRESSLSQYEWHRFLLSG